MGWNMVFEQKSIPPTKSTKVPNLIAMEETHCPKDERKPASNVNRYAHPTPPFIERRGPGNPESVGEPKFNQPQLKVYQLETIL